jgi:putative hemolysin
MITGPEIRATCNSYRLRSAQTKDDVRAALRLRFEVFKRSLRLWQL